MNRPIPRAFIRNIHMEILPEEYYVSNNPWISYLHKWRGILDFVPRFGIPPSPRRKRFNVSNANRFQSSVSSLLSHPRSFSTFFHRFFFYSTIPSLHFSLVPFFVSLACLLSFNLQNFARFPPPSLRVVPDLSSPEVERKQETEFITYAGTCRFRRTIIFSCRYQ